MQKPSLGDRIRLARKHAGMNQAQLAEAAKLKQQTISSLETNEQSETSGIVRIARACGVNPFWLEDGTGEMLDPLLTTDDSLRSVVKAMENLPEYDRKTAARIVQTFAQESQRGTGTE